MQSLMQNISSFNDLIPDAVAIHLAVSTLSPVNIHTLIPAFLIFSIVSHTFS